MVSRDTSSLVRLPNESTYRLLDGLNLVFTIHAIYHYLVRNFGKYDQLDVVVWSFKVRSCDDPAPRIVINPSPPRSRRKLL